MAESTAKSEPPFDDFLSQLSRALRRQSEHAANVTDELRDHLEERLTELLERGVPREAAVQTAIDELGEAAALAAEFNTVSRDLRRRWIMRYASASVAAAVLLLLVTAAFWPETRTTPRAPQATAQEVAPPKEATATIPKISTKEENNIRTEKLLAAHRMKVDIEEMTMKKFGYEYLQKVRTEDGKTVELQVFINQKKLEESNVQLDTPLAFHMASVRLDTLLDLVLKNLGLGYYVDDGIIIISSKEDVDTRMEVRVYNCRDLLQLPHIKPRSAGKPASGGPPGVEPPAGGGAPPPMGGLGGGALGGGGGDLRQLQDVDLVEVLLTNIKPDSWVPAGGPGTVTEYRGMLVVTQTAEVHRQIDQLLGMLRQTTAKEGAPKE